MDARVVGEKRRVVSRVAQSWVVPLALLSHLVACSSEGSSQEGTEASDLRTNLEAGGEVASPTALSKVRPGLLKRFRGEWRDLGSVEFVKDPHQEVAMPRVVYDEETPDRDVDDSRVLLFSASAGRAFLVETSPRLRAPGSNEGPILSGLAEPSSNPLDRELEDLTPFGWSNGVDNRTRRGIADIEGTLPPDPEPSDFHSEYRKIGFLSGGCTGTVVSGTSSELFVLTAAHCVVNGSGNITLQGFDPRRDDGAKPFGHWAMDSTSTDVLVHPSFISQSCFDNYPSILLSCVSHDIAILRVTPDSGTTMNPGTFTFGAFGKEGEPWLKDNTKFHRGYPGCGLTGSPAACRNRTLYGDGAFSIGTWGATQSGYYRRAKFSSDLSKGHSGGPLYVDFEGGRYVFGVTSAEDCEGAACGSGTLVNWTRLIDLWWEDQMEAFIE